MTTFSVQSPNSVTILGPVSSAPSLTPGSSTYSSANHIQIQPAPSQQATLVTRAEKSIANSIVKPSPTKAGKNPNECIRVGVFKENFNHLTINANFYKQSLYVLHVIDVCRYQLKMKSGDYLLDHNINDHKLIFCTNFCREEVSPGSS